MKRKLLYQIILSLLFVGVAQQFNSCKKVDLERTALVKTVQVSGITLNTAIVSGTIIDLGDDPVTEYGFAYSTTENPTTGNQVVIATGDAKLGDYSLTISGISPSTSYFVRSYLKMGSKELYGESLSFSTVNLPTVITAEVTNITANAASCGGNVTQDGGATVTARGICWSTNSTPTIADNTTANGTGTGSFVSQATSLTPETQYYVRAYATNSAGTAYGERKEFTTPAGVNPTTEWLHYDNGVNYDGIGLTAGGDYDVTIRFTPEMLAPYNGWAITKIKFFPKVGLPVSYSLEIYEGADMNNYTLQHLEDVVNPTINSWNEITINEPFTINAARELLVGYWVQNSDAATYPAGCDEGPAVASYGDLISTDGGTTWYSLSIAAPALNFNWNIQVYVVSPGGIQKQLTIHEKPAPVRVPFVASEFGSPLFGSSKQTIK